MEQYIWQNQNWPQFYWNPQSVIYPLADLYHNQGFLEGQLMALEPELQTKMALNCFTSEIYNSYKLENIELNKYQLKSLISQKLDIKTNLPLSFENAENKNINLIPIVNVFFNTLGYNNKEITIPQLISWNKQLPYINQNEDNKQENTKKTPLQEFRTEEYENAPSPAIIQQELQRFLNWFNSSNSSSNINNVIKSAVSHLFFIIIHPFEENNNILARNIAYIKLGHQDYIEKTENNQKNIYIKQLYSLNSQLFNNKSNYDFMLDKTIKGSCLDITSWILWYIDKLNQAVLSVKKQLENLHKESEFIDNIKNYKLNSRQEKIVLSLIEDSDGEAKITSTNYAEICDCSQDTAGRDLDKLVAMDIIAKGNAGGRSTFYYLKKL